MASLLTNIHILSPFSKLNAAKIPILFHHKSISKICICDKQENTCNLLF